jgi:hypothetical protein
MNTVLYQNNINPVMNLNLMKFIKSHPLPDQITATLETASLFRRLARMQNPRKSEDEQV